MLDLVLAILHHILIFGIFGILFAEVMAVRSGMSSATARGIASMDLWYGIFAGAVLIIGFCRAIFTAKGWAYYSHNAFFWAKITTFGVIARYYPRHPLSRLFGGGNREPHLGTLTLEQRGDICMSNSRFLSYCLFFAAAMARGYGEF